MKNIGYSKLAYCLLAFFFGYLGIHSFYASKPIQGVLFIIFSLINYVLLFILIGYFLFMIESLIILIQIFIAIGKPTNEYGNIN
ncbi:NINE protein [Streptobacillus moniliformis]|uniref:NINE protein n=1 Tax=Streptobacillus moniliformis TaxID=34105 RepID=UPI0007E3B1B3|nr:TM2 domain-containing protein [Streptobacillus moniliformis]